DTSSADTINFIAQPSNEPKSHLPYHLFGTLKSSTQQDYNNVNKTRLNLVLMGILKQQNNSLAIIKNGSIKSKIYKLGDFITPSVSIKEIYPEYIIIENNSNLEKLELKRKEIEFNTAHTQDDSDEIRITTKDKSKLQRYLTQLNTNPKKLLSIVSVRPNYNNKTLRGFVISPGSEKALFQELGFKKNDIILSINDTTLNNLSQAIKLRKDLAEQKYFNFTIDRQGSIQSLSIDLN
ncbi:MAG: hypothetical protein NZ811_01625, partial [Gammaproteobacteria bacterium]|nr:hypothetical protein [Gammaproteobacteria bacterium]